MRRGLSTRRNRLSLERNRPSLIALLSLAYHALRDPARGGHDRERTDDGHRDVSQPMPRDVRPGIDQSYGGGDEHHGHHGDEERAYLAHVIHFYPL